MTLRTPVVGGNWKMNTMRASAVALATGVRDAVAALPAAEARAVVEIAVYPPFPYIGPVREVVGRVVGVGGQDVFPEPEGAFTGEISVGMLRDMGADRVLVGHSERRHVIGETDELINRKLRAALDGGLQATLCVGETSEQRSKGTTEAIVAKQLSAGLAGVEGVAPDRLIIAYEPVWAIGTGLTATPSDAKAVHAMIRRTLASRYDDASATGIRIQYGGSVKPANAADLIVQDNIDGFLVGGASLHAEDFQAIIQATAAYALAANTR